MNFGYYSCKWRCLRKKSRHHGRPRFEKLFAAGIILAHQDWSRMKCGSGLTVATAYGAIKSFSNLQL
jgi:anaerobic glycerol-3-phosphate dehydrogenase